MFTGGDWRHWVREASTPSSRPAFVDKQPLALARAYNAASVGGKVFSPRWAVLINRAGAPAASTMVRLFMVAVVMFIATLELARTPLGEGQGIDGRRQVNVTAVALFLEDRQQPSGRRSGNNADS